MTFPSNEAEIDHSASSPDAGVLEAVSQIEGDVVVAGAGGKMGFHLCLMLRRALDRAEKENSRVFAVSRFPDPAKRNAFKEKGIETVACDLTKEEDYEALPRAAAAFFLAGLKFGTGDSPELLRKFNISMPEKFARHYSDVPIVALSTGCVYPFVDPASGGSKETDPVGPAGDYAASCLGRENAFVAESKRTGTPIALIRLNYSVDLRYGVLVDIAEKVFRGEPVDVSMGFMNCIWQGDACRYIVKAMADAEPAPTPYILNVTGERVLRVREVAHWYGQRFGVDPEIIGEEAETAWLNDAGQSHIRYGKPVVDELTLMERVAAWIEQGGRLLGKPTHFEVRDGKY